MRCVYNLVSSDCYGLMVMISVTVCIKISIVRSQSVSLQIRRFVVAICNYTGVAMD